ncbi:hypothetical protein NEOLI_004210 [Neolecta irregularis DAH-3]|uniref:Uncharacterized protein n=1 Tax=Neolecta irregularis (strain DAH-3) TaxID=1198029 RepID=A0A1U7LGL5_NEOID|nr:hypothetical protein NEOLI_004210 [Neolecta irregularis DAH-3]|eukprot:OLL21800.1 hypothetical protein NEOLI_004210 [Neolecta irregularis DAH-3]
MMVGGSRYSPRTIVAVSMIMFTLLNFLVLLIVGRTLGDQRSLSIWVFISFGLLFGGFGTGCCILGYQRTIHTDHDSERLGSASEQTETSIASSTTAVEKVEETLDSTMATEKFFHGGGLPPIIESDVHSPRGLFKV